MAKPDRVPLVGDALGYMVRRFELTIPLRKPVIVDFRGITCREDHSVTGLPYAVRGGVIYVMVQPAWLQPIAQAHILDIRLAFPPGANRNATTNPLQYPARNAQGDRASPGVYP